MTNIMTAADVAALTDGALETSLGAVANPSTAIRLVDMSDPRLKAIAEHAIHSLNGELRSTEHWSCVMEGECTRIEQWHPRSVQAKQARKSYDDTLARVEHLRAAIDLAREILGDAAKEGAT